MKKQPIVDSEMRGGGTLAAHFDPAVFCEVRIPCGSVVLDGELAIPTGAEGVVVFAHGSGSSRRSPRNQFVARVIRESGSATLLFDLLTAEEEVEDEVTGSLRFDIGLLAGRLVEVTRWLIMKPVTRALGIGYFGASTGAAAALMAAAEAGDRIRAVVSRGGRPDLAGNALSRVVSPTLLIVGGLDDVVIRLNEEAFASLCCEKEMKIVEGATHLFEERGALESVAQLASGWFCKYLRRHGPAED
ncbi:DeoR family transcriptional regulator [Verrucomicrobiota bacterium]|nr:DeoR family transcriptional regulator [Verrucomicrobiota bacterium]